MLKIYQYELHIILFSVMLSVKRFLNVVILIGLLLHVLGSILLCALPLTVAVRLVAYCLEEVNLHYNYNGINFEQDVAEVSLSCNYVRQ